MGDDHGSWFAGLRSIPIHRRPREAGMRRFIDRFQGDESGATAIEYGLICALIFLAIVTSISALANSQNGGLAKTVERLSSAINAVVGG